MHTQNSYAEFILGTFRAQLVDCARWYPELASEFTRDLLRLSSAIESHGVRFALDIVPRFGKHLDKCLSERRLIPSNLLHFGVGKKGEVIPRLFRGLTLRVFDRNGLLKSQPDVDALRLLRQLCRVVKKVRMESSPKDQGNAVREFYQTDFGVASGSLSWDDHISFGEEINANVTSFTDAAEVVDPLTEPFLPGMVTPTPPLPTRTLLDTCQRVADLVSGTVGCFHPEEWKLRHGPGAVSDQSYGSYKYSFQNWPDRLDNVFPWADFAFANYACVESKSIEESRACGETREYPARLCAVPKTISTPRLIASEPTSLQWCQQAVRDFFYSRVEHTVLSGFVDFRRQDKNGRLALEASRDQSCATIDLSSASDRVSCWHVERLFRRSPTILAALQATRSVWVTQDICRKSPKLHLLRKYSTMGNATTFPVQTLFFLTLALAAVFHTRKLPVSYATLRALGDGEVRVFGDDIIVPKDCSGLLVGLLEALSLKVNVSKTFLEGNFRESCGVDAYMGHDVSAVSVLEMPRRASPSSIVSTVDAHNNLLIAGYEATAAFLRKTANIAGYKQIRDVKYGDGAFGWYVYGVPDTSRFPSRVCRNTQVRMIKCLNQSVKDTRLPPEGTPGLLQFFTEAAKKVTSASSTLGYLGRRPKSRLALRWVPA